MHLVVRRFVVIVGLSAGSAGSLFACAEDGTTAATSDADAASDATASGDSASDPTTDGGSDAGAVEDAKPGKDANGALGEGAECAFNRECQAALRCECSEASGCACKPGARGTGKNGVDACDSGEQCASSVCVESATANEFLCSDECASELDCEPKLPRCLPTFGFPSPICVREPPK